MNANGIEIVRGGTGAPRNASYSVRKLVCARQGMLTAILGVGLTTALVLIPAGRATAQLGSMINPDGAFPTAGLVLSGNMLYGTAQAGGNWGHGALFAVNTEGTAFMSLHSFTGSGDGMNPYGALTSLGNTLYGTANSGGNTGAGTVFMVNAEGSSFMTLHNFAATDSASINNEGAEPYARLILSGNTLYGTAEEGGTAGSGAVFALNTDGTQFTNLHSFTATSSNGASMTNSDGAEPQAGLILLSSALYGAAFAGGIEGSGAIFAVNTNGTGFTNLHSFTASSTNSSGVYTNSDGANPTAGMISSGNTLYGTAENGGSSGSGTLFAINTDGTGFRVVHTFTELTDHTNSDGATPHAGLVLSGNTLYGAAEYGGIWGNGMVFAVNTDGTGFTNLYSFSLLGPPGTNSDGTYPYGTLVLSSNTLYGTALFGGNLGNGTVFAVNTDGTGFTTLHSFTKLVMPVPQLTITVSGPNMVLAWPANTGSMVYSLESTTDIHSPSWEPVSFTAALVHGQNIVTLAAGSQQFFRLNLLVGGCLRNSDCPIGSMCVGNVCMAIIGPGGPGFGFGFGFGFGNGNGICSGCGG